MLDAPASDAGGRAHRGERWMNGEDEDWCGLAVRTRDGTRLGVVVGVFAEGLLAGRLRVQGEYRRRWASWTDTAVYAIPRAAVLRRRRGSLVLDATPPQARGRWLVHVLQAKQA
jgi:hypothetical protein